MMKKPLMNSIAITATVRLVGQSLIKEIVKSYSLAMPLKDMTAG